MEIILKEYNYTQRYALWVKWTYKVDIIFALARFSSQGTRLRLRWNMVWDIYTHSYSLNFILVCVRQ